MGTLRRHIYRHGWLAALLVGFALLARIMIPTGFMPVQSANGLIIELCTGHGPVSIILDVPQKPGSTDGDHHDGGKEEGSCTFAGLGMSFLSGAAPVLLAITIAFIHALGFLPFSLRPFARPLYLRPPLRAPPVGC